MSSGTEFSDLKLGLFLTLNTKCGDFAVSKDDRLPQPIYYELKNSDNIWVRGFSLSFWQFFVHRWATNGPDISLHVGATKMFFGFLFFNQKYFPKKHTVWCFYANRHYLFIYKVLRDQRIWSVQSRHFDRDAYPSLDKPKLNGKKYISITRHSIIRCNPQIPGNQLCKSFMST